MNAALIDLRQRIADAIGTSGVVLSNDLLQSPDLTNDWNICLGLSGIAGSSLSFSPGLVLSEVTADAFCLSGTLSVPGWNSDLTTLYFFTSTTSLLSTPSTTIEAFFKFGGLLPDNWHVAPIFPSSPSYAEYCDGSPVSVGPIFAELPFSTATALYSSYDFSVAAKLNDGVTPPPCSNTLPAQAGATLATRGGVTISGQIPTNGNIWKDVRQLFAMPATLALTAHISRITMTQAAQIEACIDLSAEPPTIKPGSIKASLSLQQIMLSTALDRASDVEPALLLGLTLDIDQASLPLVVDIFIGAGSGSIASAFDTPVRYSNAWLNALNLEHFAPLIPGADHIGDLALSAFKATFSVAPADLTGITVTIAPTFPWMMIPDLLAVDPVFTFGLANQNEGGSAYVEVFADWYFGGSDSIAPTVLEVYARTDSGDLSISLSPGESLDSNAVFTELLGLSAQAKICSLTLNELELTGNYHDHTVSFEAESDVWTVQLGYASKPVSLTVTDLILRADYAPDNSFSGVMSGAFCVGGCIVDIAIAASEGEISVDASFPQLPLGNLVDDVLSEIQLPSEFLDGFVVDLDITLSEARLEAKASQTSAAVTLFPGFDFSITKLDILRQDKQLTANVSIALDLGGHPVAFSGCYSTEQGTKLLASQTGESIDLSALIARIEAFAGIDYPLLSKGLAISDINAVLVLDSDKYFGIQCSLTDSTSNTVYGHLQIYARKPASDLHWSYCLFVVPHLKLDLTKLPVAGEALAHAGITASASGVLVVSHGAFSAAQLAKMATDTGGSLTPPDVAIVPGATLIVDCVLDGYALNYALTLFADKPPRNRVLPEQTTATAASAGITQWSPVNKSFGSLSIARLGARYANDQLLLMVDAGLSIGPVSLVVDGLGIGSSLNHLSPVVALDGLGVALQTEALSVTGELARSTDGVQTSYTGMLQLATEAVDLTLLGKYSKQPGFTSLFFFGLLDKPMLGGPPFFFVEGVAIAGGYNNQLTMPLLDSLETFPLIAAALPSTNPFLAPTNLDNVITKLGSNFQAVVGDMWFAAGLRFTSFQLVDTFALAVVEFGNTVELALLGVSQASIPADPGATPIAFAQVDFEATFLPAAGILQVIGALTPNSYVISQSCHLTGSFAFCTWMRDVQIGPDNVSAGQFVYSLGGYHPQFKTPAYFPVLPRLGLNWQVDDNLTIDGTAYFALTPACVMAGMSMSAVWSAGSVRAWFDCSADFLLSWKPFHYTADINCSIGVSFRIHLIFTTVTLSVSVGVSFSVQGPEFGGTAEIDLRLISISIHFGARSSPPSLPKWPEFRDSFLPGKTDSSVIQGSQITAGIFHASPTNGLFRDLSSSAKAPTARWIFRGAQLSIAMTTPAPANALFINRKPYPKSEQTWSSTAGINPMGVQAAQYVSEIQIGLDYNGKNGWATYGAATFVPIVRPMPAALWRYVEDAAPTSPNTPAFLTNALCGVQLTPVQTAPGHTCEIPILSLQYGISPPVIQVYWVEPLPPQTDPFQRSIDANLRLHYTVGSLKETCSGYVLSAATDDADARLTAINAMAGLGMPVNTAVDLSALTSTTVLNDWPRIGFVGEPQ